MADPTTAGDDAASPYVAEFQKRLQAIADQLPQSRLLVDLARDAGLEAIRRLSSELGHAKKYLRRVERKRRKLNNRLAELLHDLAVGPILLPLPADCEPADPADLVPTFRRLRDEAYPAVANKLAAASGGVDAAAFSHVLVTEVLLKGCSILTEHVVRRVRDENASPIDDRFLAELRDHVSGNLNHTLAAETALQVTPDTGRHLESLIARSLKWLGELQTTSPSARLLVPKTGEAYDPDRHARACGRESSSSRAVRQTAFPGLYLPGSPPTVLERAVVNTYRLLPASARDS